MDRPFPTVYGRLWPIIAAFGTKNAIIGTLLAIIGTPFAVPGPHKRPFHTPFQT